MLGGNVLMVSHFPSDTAYAWWLMEHFWKTIAELAEQDGSKAFLAFPEINSVSKTILDAPLAAVTLSLPRARRWPSAKVRAFLADNEIRTIYFTDSPYLSTQYLAFRILGVAEIIVHDHTAGDRPPVTGLAGVLKAIKNRLPAITADKIFCVSPHMRNRSLRNARIPERRIHVVQNGIEPIKCPVDARSTVRSEFGIAQDEIVMISTGRAHPYKRWDLIVETAAKLRELAPDLRYRFLLVGDGHFMPKLKALVDELDLYNEVVFCGFRADAHRLICAADIAIHAAKGEGFSLSILEYMSAGLPTIVPDVPSVAQAITHGTDGFIFSDNDPGNAAYYLNELARDAELRSEMSARAKNRVVADFNLEQCTEAFIEAVRA